jgi:hypothetical protein
VFLKSTPSLEFVIVHLDIPTGYKQNGPSLRHHTQTVDTFFFDIIIYYYVAVRPLTIFENGEYKLDDNNVQGGLVPNKISGVGTNFGLLVYVVPGPNKQRAFEPSMILS